MKKIDKKQLINFLNAVDDSFPVPLSKKQNLNDFANKLLSHANLYYRLNDQNEIISLVAGYINDYSSKLAYISIVATLPDYRGNGYAKELMSDFINECKNQDMKAVHLYMVETNYSAKKMYTSMGFTRWFVKDEKRKNDIHLILFL